MASKVEICNLALQKLGARAIVSLSEDSRNARACNLAYESCKKAELRDHTWNFAIERATLAADATAPEWGRDNAFELPSDFIRLLAPYPEDKVEDLDYQIEGTKIYTDESAPLYIRYVKNVTDTATFDDLFVQVLACRLAMEICEEITQSTQKLQNIMSMYESSISKAKKTNALEKPKQSWPDNSWITCRG